MFGIDPSGWNVSCRVGYLPLTGFRCPFHGTPEPHPTESKTEYEDEFEFEYDLGNEKERGGSRAIAESVFFEPGICPSLSNRSEKVGIARPKRDSNLPQSHSYSNSSSYSVPSLIFPNGIAYLGAPAWRRIVV